MALTKVEAEQLQAAQTSITSVGTLTGLTISGDLTVDTSTLKVDSSNNRVGIGNASPDETLHIKGDGARILIDSDDYNLFSIGRRASSGTGLDNAYLRLKNAGTTTAVIDTAGASYFNGGDVGIGIASPAAELHVNALSENVNLRLTRDTNYGVQITGTDGATTPVLRLATINNGTVTERLRMSESALSPTTDQGMALGTSSNRFNKLFVKTSETQKFYIQGASTTADSSFMMSYFDTTLSGSDSLTADRANYGIYSALNSSATGGTTSNEHRLYGIRSLVKATGDSDLIYGGYFTGEAEHSSGTVSALYGSYNQGTADPNSGGTVSVTYGTFNQASINGVAGSTITHGYGSYNRILTSTADVVAHSSLTGCYAEIETDASGTGRTTTNGYIFRGVYDDDSSAEHKFTNFYGLNLTGSNLATRVDGTGTVAGVYLDMPGVDQGFWNSEDQSNYFRGSLGIGSGGRQVGDTVGAELHLVEPDGGEMVLARYDSTIGTGNSLGKIFFGGTEDSGTTVNFSASIQAFAQSGHTTTDADGYLSFYTTPQSSTTLSERMRIDRAGNVLAGTNFTDTTLYNNTSGGGIMLGAANRLDVARDGDVAATFNRSSGAGEVINLYQGGSKAGGLGVSGTDITIGTGDTGITFEDAADTVHPVNFSSGAARSGAINLGKDAARFQHLYLSALLDIKSSDCSGFLQAGSNVLQFGTSTSDPLIFYTNNQERMRITSTGNLLLGRTSTGNGSTDHGMHLYNTGQIYLYVNGTGNTDAFRVYDGNGDLKAAIDSDGDYIDHSDINAKENIQDASSVLSTLSDVKVRSFTWKADGRNQDYGFIAQELKEVVPEAVSSPETEGEMWGVKYAKLVPMLVKAVQEQQATITALEARIVQLENK